MGETYYEFKSRQRREAEALRVKYGAPPLRTGDDQELKALIASPEYRKGDKDATARARVLYDTLYPGEETES